MILKLSGDTPDKRRMKAPVFQSPFGMKLELDSFLDLLQEQYGEAFAADDREGLIQTCGVLAITYAGLDRPELARRWAVQYLSLLDIAMIFPNE